LSSAAQAGPANQHAEFAASQPARRHEDASGKERLLLSDFESGLTKAERKGIGDGVRQGIEDIEARRFEEYDAKGLRDLAKELVAASVKKRASRPKGR
jgi:hypothetical protein